MIEQLALHHQKWVNMARTICKDNYLADDLVSEMYIRLSNHDKEVNDFYVYLTIKHRYMDHMKEEKQYASIESATDISAEEEEILLSIELPDCITWVEKQILLLRQEKSGREIEKQYHINFQKVHRIEKKAKEKLEVWARTLQEPVTF